jgi:serine/threonine-protein kinase RsbW
MPLHSWSWSAELSIPSAYAAGKSVIDQLLGQLQRAQWNEHEIFGVHLAVEEALVNAIRHGNKLDESKSVRVHCKISVERLWIQIADEGRGFDPKRIPDPTADENLETPGGRGVLLMKNFMSRVEYNEAGNCVVMEKHRGDGAEVGG